MSTLCFKDGLGRRQVDDCVNNVLDEFSIGKGVWTSFSDCRNPA
jgi:hypothetical protein